MYCIEYLLDLIFCGNTPQYSMTYRLSWWYGNHQCRAHPFLRRNTLPPWWRTKSSDYPCSPVCSWVFPRTKTFSFSSYLIAKHMGTTYCRKAMYSRAHEVRSTKGEWSLKSARYGRYPTFFPTLWSPPARFGYKCSDLLLQKWCTYDDRISIYS